MQLEYKTHGTCSRTILIDVDDDTKTVRDVSFAGGCHGNLQGIAALVRGQKASDIVQKLEGIKCGAKPTSCPDQLAQALKQIL